MFGWFGLVWKNMIQNAFGAMAFHFTACLLPSYGTAACRCTHLPFPVKRLLHLGPRPALPLMLVVPLLAH